MPPPSDHPALSLILFAESLIVHKLPIDEPIPDNLLNLLTKNTTQDSFISISRTSEEVSIVAHASSSPALNVPRWRCIKIKGPMDFGLTGIMCDFTTPLKHAGISVFALSTWNTDYILVPETKVNDAVNVLKEDGWKFDA
ncbi:ACT domain-containing protein [Phellopilus nigrolimitatus]|nr:ACT domain-containing protein [Phellopilus nigrolimitatus]